MRKDLLKTLVILFLSLVPANAFAGQSADQEVVKANRMYTDGKYFDALEVYQRVLKVPSSHISKGEIYSHIGDCYFRVQDYQNALNAYRCALPNQQRSKQPPTQYWIGFCAFLLGKNNEAITEFLKIPENYPSSGMWVGTAYYWAGRACERMGKKGLAADFYRKASGAGKSIQERFALKKAEKISSSK